MSRGNMIDRDLFSLCGGGISCNVVCVWVVHLRTRCLFFLFFYFSLHTNESRALFTKPTHFTFQ